MLNSSACRNLRWNKTAVAECSKLPFFLFSTINKYTQTSITRRIHRYIADPRWKGFVRSCHGPMQPKLGRLFLNTDSTDATVYHRICSAYDPFTLCLLANLRMDQGLIQRNSVDLTRNVIFFLLSLKLRNWLRCFLGIWSWLPGTKTLHKGCTSRTVLSHQVCLVFSQ